MSADYSTGHIWSDMITIICQGLLYGLELSLEYDMRSTSFLDSGCNQKGGDPARTTLSLPTVFSIVHQVQGGVAHVPHQAMWSAFALVIIVSMLLGAVRRRLPLRAPAQPRGDSSSGAYQRSCSSGSDHGAGCNRCSGCNHCSRSDHGAGQRPLRPKRPAPLAAAAEPLIFGIVLVGPYNDHGWSEAHYLAGKYAEAQDPRRQDDLRGQR